jgi:hypothetical protein
MTLANSFDASKRANQVAVRCLFGEREQLVRDTTHGRDDDDRSSLHLAGDDLACAADRLGVSDRCAPELDDDHAAGSSPRTFNSSALSTDPPAAPRTVL